MKYEIENLEELLQPSLEEGTTITKTTINRLTVAGENYGSLMLAVELKLKKNDKEDYERTLNLVAKMCPPNELLKQIFNVNISFRKEIAVYKTIFPVLKEFTRRSGTSGDVSFLCDCYGARISLDPFSKVVDNDAVLILENLKISGYEIVDRMKGFNLETTRLLLNNLAIFHALPVALKLLQPETFAIKIRPHLQRNNVFDTLTAEAEKAIIESVLKTAKCNNECVPLLDRVHTKLTEGFRNIQNSVPVIEPFATINHNDFWVNNMMIKFENNNPTKSKFVDFQVIDYGSPGKDIVFFLFSSVQKDVLNAYFDDFLKLYYNKFIDTLRNLQCDVAPFKYEAFLTEINSSAKSTEFAHILIMVRHVFALKGKVKEISEMTMDDLVSEVQISDEYRDAVPHIILNFAKRGWI